MMRKLKRADPAAPAEVGSLSTENLPLRVRFAFFGTSHIAAYVLDALEGAGFLPALAVTLPEKPSGRGLRNTPTDVEQWADERNIPTLKPEKLDEHFSSELRAGGYGLDVAIVVDYGKILPKKILDIPRKGFLNVHPSLLPRLRGPSPMRSAILRDERETGVSIILVDEEMDHGPLIAQKKVDMRGRWPVKNSELERILMREGGRLLARILPEYIAGAIEPHPQNHDLATYSEKFSKEDGLLDLSADAYRNFLKICAFESWPGTYAFFERGGKRMRVGILEAHLEHGKLVIDTVKPESKRQMPYADFIRSGASWAASGVAGRSG